jgi:hypothetical protein
MLLRSIRRGATYFCVSFNRTSAVYLRHSPSVDKVVWWMAVSPLVSARCESISASSQASAPERRTAAEAELEEKGLTRRVNL